MIIVTKIIGVLEAMVTDTNCKLKSYQYNDRPTANVRLDTKSPSPTAVFMQLTDWDMDIKSGVLTELANINVTFLSKDGKMDADGNEQEPIIDAMRDLAVEFISRVREIQSIRIEDDTVKVKSVFLASDSNRTGVNITLTIKQKQGGCI